MISLIALLKELKSTDHYLERKNQRSNISKISIPKEAYGEYNVEETNTKLIDILKTELNTRLSRIEESDINASLKYNIGYKIFEPVIVTNNKEYPITMYVSYTESDLERTNSGRLYFGIVRDNSFITLILSNETDDIDLEKEIDNHFKRKDPKSGTSKESKILSTFDYVYRINLDELYGKTTTKEIPTEDSVDYTVRTDYRKGANFNHNKWNDGIIVNTSNGVGGKGDANGKLDWVDVDFGTMFVKGGVPTSIRRISPVYTKVYFDTHKKK